MIGARVCWTFYHGYLLRFSFRLLKQTILRIILIKAMCNWASPYCIYILFLLLTGRCWAKYVLVKCMSRIAFMIWLFFHRVCVSNEDRCVRFVPTHDLSTGLGMSIMIDAAYCPSWAFWFNLIFCGIPVAQLIAFYVLFCGSLFVFCSFSSLHLCCLSFDVLGLVT